ncbi:MAG: hypothetical protein AAFY33_09025 [Cyanobacteria bacterium J06643_4]
MKKRCACAAIQKESELFSIAQDYSAWLSIYSLFILAGGAWTILFNVFIKKTQCLAARAKDGVESVISQDRLMPKELNDSTGSYSRYAKVT